MGGKKLNSPKSLKIPVKKECYCDLGSPNKEVCPKHHKSEDTDWEKLESQIQREIEYDQLFDGDKDGELAGTIMVLVKEALSKSYQEGKKSVIEEIRSEIKRADWFIDEGEWDLGDFHNFILELLSNIELSPKKEVSKSGRKK